MKDKNNNNIYICYKIVFEDRTISGDIDIYMYYLNVNILHIHIIMNIRMNLYILRILNPMLVMIFIMHME